jgi:hypothetical protein
VTLEQFFAGREQSCGIFEALRLAVAAIGPAQLQLRVTKSQVAFRRRRPFAWAWVPGSTVRVESGDALSRAVTRDER